MSNKFSEHFIQRKLKGFLKLKGNIVLNEYPFFSRVIDIVCYNKTEDLLIAIEIKLTHLKRLIKQIEICRYFANRVYIVLPKIKYHNSIKAKLLSEDIGIITFQPYKNSVRFNYEKLPAPSSYQDASLAMNVKKQILDYTNGKTHV